MCDSCTGWTPMPPFRLRMHFVPSVVTPVTTETASVNAAESEDEFCCEDCRREAEALKVATPLQESTAELAQGRYDFVTAPGKRVTLRFLQDMWDEIAGRDVPESAIITSVGIVQLDNRERVDVYWQMPAADPDPETTRPPAVPPTPRAATPTMSSPVWGFQSRRDPFGR